MSAVCPFNFREKLQNVFVTVLKEYEMILEKSLSKKKCLEIKFADMFLLFICQSSYCPNLIANELIPFDL